MEQAVISLIGQDRAGFISDVTAIAHECHLNIADSRMTVLGGEFALLMAVQGTSQQLSQFNTRVQHLADTINAAYIYRPTQARDSAEATDLSVTISAIDHPGIVHSIARFFSARHINIADLTTRTEPAAHTGTPVFSVDLTAEIPTGTDLEELKTAFETFCEDAGLDGEFA